MLRLLSGHLQPAADSKVKFVDYMTQSKIDGEWKIVNKSFYAEPKQRAETKKNQ